MKGSKKLKIGIVLFLIFTLVFCFTSALLILLGRYIDAPSNELTTLKADESVCIVIDAGHGGEDGGAVGVNGGYEKDVNLSLSLTLKDILTEKGFTVIMTRSEDVLLYDKNSDHEGHKKEQDLLNRRKIVESLDDPILISIHMNSFPIEKYSGLQVYYSTNDPSSRLLAEKIQSLSRERLNAENKRTVKPSDGIYLLDHINTTSVLVECGFLSNQEECELLFTSEYQKRIAQCIADAIVEQLEEQKDEVST